MIFLVENKNRLGVSSSQTQLIISHLDKKQQIFLFIFPLFFI